MKTVFLSLWLVGAMLSVGGCAFMDSEDRDFYGKGWVKPTDLDREPVTHRIVDPSHPESQAATTSTATRTVPAATPEPEWITPIPSTQ